MTRLRREVVAAASAALCVAACADILGADFGEYGAAPSSGGGSAGADASSGGGLGGVGATDAMGGALSGGGSGGEAATSGVGGTGATTGGAGGSGGVNTGGSGGTSTGGSAGTNTGGSGGTSTGGTGGTSTGGSGGTSTGGSGNTGGGASGGSAGAGGSGGSGGGSGGSGGSGGGCPVLPGPVLRQVPAPGGGSYCIDSTEVSKTQYAAYLSTNPSAANQPAQCAWNASLVPSKQWPPVAGTEKQPAAWLDWCDAHAYCTSVGKRLCGKIGGGSTNFGLWDVASQSQWFNACSSFVALGVALAYPYGNSYQPTICNGNDNGASFDMLDVGSQPGCQSAQLGFTGVFDMSGNAYEWEDSCDGSTGATDKCRVRGGGTNQTSPGLRCDADLGIFARDFTNDLVGFRCCYP